MAGARLEKPCRDRVWSPTTAQIPPLLPLPCPLPYGGENVPYLPVCSNSIQNGWIGTRLRMQICNSSTVSFSNLNSHSLYNFVQFCFPCVVFLSLNRSLTSPCFPQSLTRFFSSDLLSPKPHPFRGGSRKHKLWGTNSFWGLLQPSSLAVALFWDSPALPLCCSPPLPPQAAAWLPPAPYASAPSTGQNRARAERQERGREVTHAGQELLRGQRCSASTRRVGAEPQHEHWDWGRRSWNLAFAPLSPAEWIGTEQDYLGATGERGEQVSPRSSAGTILGKVRRATVPPSISYTSTKGGEEFAHCWKRHLDGAQTGQAEREWKNKPTEHRPRWLIASHTERCKYKGTEWSWHKVSSAPAVSPQSLSTAGTLESDQ